MMERCGWNDSTSDFAPYPVNQIGTGLEQLLSDKVRMIVRKLGLVERTEWHRRVVALPFLPIHPMYIRQTLVYCVKIDSTIQINGGFHHE
jgi:hypothetical protein